jgi:hypothetical protein
MPPPPSQSPPPLQDKKKWVLQWAQLYAHPLRASCRKWQALIEHPDPPMPAFPPEWTREQQQQLVAQLPRRIAMMAWGGEGAFWSGTSHFKFSKPLHMRSALLDLVRSPCLLTPPLMLLLTPPLDRSGSSASSATSCMSAITRICLCGLPRLWFSMKWSRGTDTSALLAR